MIKTMPADFYVSYEWVAGSMPPPYHYEYTVKIYANGSGKVIFIPDYPGKDVPVWEADFKVAVKDVEDLYQLMVKEKFFKTKWEQRKPHPIGGSHVYITAFANGKETNVPAYPKKEELLTPIIDAIQNLFPKEIMDDFRKKREAYENEYLEKRRNE